MRVRLLGTAAGGGVPQWNCACQNCTAARRGEIPARTQSGVAISGDGQRWFLVNASPDLRAQIESFPRLAPQTGRGTAIEGVLLTNADLDHVLGLFLLREGGPLAIHAPPGVRQSLAGSLQLDNVLQAFGGVRWHDYPEAPQLLHDRAGEPTGLSVRAIPLPASAPLYDRHPHAAGHSVALEFSDAAHGQRVVVAPDVGAMTPALALATRTAAAVIIDGTFWSDDELAALRPGARTAREMGHLPLSGPGGTLEILAQSEARRKMLIHINNTNPILALDSPERRLVEAAGVTIPPDGETFSA